MPPQINSPETFAPTTLWPAVPIAFARNVQGKSPAKTKRGYGTRSSALVTN